MTTNPGYIKINANGTLTTVDANTVTDTTKFLQEAVGGWFDVVSADSSMDFWLNDEGIYTQSVNPVGTALMHHYLGRATQSYFGTIVIARSNDEGETIPLTAKDIEEITATHRAIRT